MNEIQTPPADTSAPQGETHVVALPPRVDLAAVADLKIEVISARSAQRNLDFDASNVERIGAAGVQFLTMARSAMKELNLSSKISSPSDETRTAFEELGFRNQLED